MDPLVFRAVRNIPELGIDAGDDVVFDPAAPRLFTLCKKVDPGAVLLNYENGLLIPLGPAPMPADLAKAVGASTPPHGKRPPSLRLES